MSRTSKVLIFVIVILFLVFVWPTRYKYLSGWDTPARVDRITGKIEWAGEDGWTSKNPLFDVQEDSSQASGGRQQQQNQQDDDDDGTCEATAPFPSQSKL